MRFVPVLKAGKKRSGNPQQEALHRAAGTTAPTIEMDFLKAAEYLQNGVSRELVEDLLRRGALDKIDLPWENFEKMLRSGIEPSILTTIRRAADEASTFTAGTLRKALGYSPVLSFDATNPRLRKWIQKNTGNMIQGVTEETKQAVRTAVKRSLSEELNDVETFRAVRRSIGLSERQSIAVQNVYFNRLNQGLDRDEAMREADAYAQRQLVYRARAIASHETMRATNQGQEEGWHQAADEGLFDKDQATVDWDAAPGDRTCPTCRGMDGKSRPLDGEWTVVIRDSKGNPVDTIETDNPQDSHPGCRCTKRLNPGG